MTRTTDPGEEPLTPDEFRRLWDMAQQLIAAEEAFKLWSRILAERRQQRGEAGPLNTAAWLGGTIDLK